MVEERCNVVHVRKGPCQLAYGHDGPHVWQKDGEATEVVKIVEAA